MGTHSLIISQRLDDNGNIARLRLTNADGSPVPEFTAGAHLDFHLANVDLWRQYSICSDPAERDFYEIGVLKDPKSRGGSIAMHDKAVEGATMQVEGPRNNFPLVENAKTTVLYGGGIGVTPLISMAKRLHSLGVDFKLHYCTRSEDVTAFRSDLQTAPFADRIVFHFDDGDDEQRLSLERDLPEPDSGTHLYVCGPQGFMDWIIGTAENNGHATSHVHREYFSADVDTAGDSFEVEARESGVTLTVGPDDTIAKALAKAGIHVDVKCEEGVCGTCVTDVLSGAIDHRDQFLTEEEREDGDQICVCCSRASGRLVLDI